MKLPPHTTYVLQPLDVAVFKGLTTNWDKELCKWQRANPRKKIPKPEFVSLITNLTKALCKWQRANPRKKIPKPEFVSLITNLTKALPAAHIINGFKTTSIYDAEVNGVNKDIIPETIFKKADLEKYKTILSEVRAALTPPSTQEVSTTSIVAVLPEIAQVSAAEQPAVATTSMDESRKSFEELLLNLLKKAIC
ncbi:ISXO2-like transposase domain [Popillia japonica]|uniref:ISXO2-like transposase domain n=1 Tax=Popillia japonica TaxID=7064 RepID=A0AAW1N137_POPJA